MEMFLSAKVIFLLVNILTRRKKNASSKMNASTSRKFLCEFVRARSGLKGAGILLKYEPEAPANEFVA